MNTILAVISGILTALSMPGFLPGFIVWFSLVPLVYSLRRSKPLKAGLLSFLFFFTHLTVSHFWLLDTLTRNLPTVLKNYPPYLGTLVFLLFGIYESLFMIPLGLSVSIFKFRSPIIRSILFASTYTVLERLREIGDMGFTGGRLSDALAFYPGYTFITRFFGEMGLVFLIAFVNSILQDEIERRQAFRAVALILVLAMIPCAVEPLLPQTSLSEPVELRVVQTAYDPARKYSTPMEVNVEKINPRRNSIFVAPEAFLLGDPRDFYSELIEKSTENDSLLILGGLRLGRVSHNSAYYFFPDGRIERYDKIKLFPFVEFLPYPKIFFFLSFLKGMWYYSPGKEYSVFEWRGISISTQICFESYFESVSRKMVENGAQIIVIITNDGWFRSSIALKQHFAKAVMRAVENGRWVVQVANKGITGVVDDWGRTVLTIEIGKESTVDLPVQPKDGATFYTRHPNVALYISLISIFAIFILRILRAI